jgi:hypothetical protein
MVYYRGLFQDLLEDHEHSADERRDASAPRASGERVVERAGPRDDDGMEIPVKRVGEQRPNDRDFGNDREVRP